MSLFHQYEQIRELKSSLIVDSMWYHEYAGLYFKVIEVSNEDGTYKGEVTSQSNSFLCFSTLEPTYASYLDFFENWRKVR